jgi:hypothetical protein
MTYEVERLTEDLKRTTGASRVKVQAVTTHQIARAAAIMRNVGNLQSRGETERMDDGEGRLRFQPGASGFTAFDISASTWSMG